MKELDKIKQELTDIAQSDLPLVDRKKRAVIVSARFQDLLFAEKVLVQFIDEMQYPHKIEANYNPSGFYKIRLFKIDGTALRLHVNDPDSGIPDGGSKEENRHDHRWRLSSTAVVGAIGHEIYGHCPEDKPSGEKFYEYEYSQRGGRSEFEMTYVGPAYLRLTDRFILSAGKYTVMDPYKIHRAFYPDPTELTATIVLTDECRGRTKNSVFADDSIHAFIQQNNGITPTPAVSHDQAIELVGKTVAALRAQRAKEKNHTQQIHKPGLTTL